ncbi:hypothetical protein BSKO_00082 [Bryopsis sp. KO-2023]|nr:hypothetical protein BSKO_00082 [Bryopsis sp. KO-2023]
MGLTESKFSLPAESDPLDDSPTSAALGVSSDSSSTAKTKASDDASRPRCPLFHGTVYTSPYPGYVHGKHPEICAYGCKPGQGLNLDEAMEEKLLREAMEFQDLFHNEMGSTPDVKSHRKEEILASIEKTGTYTHSFEELQHGARVAWRNAPKCSNRKVWNELQLLDRRDVTTNEGMFEACLEHLKMAQKNMVTDTFITVFPPAKPGDRKSGPRVWNDQLIRYAAYRQEDGMIVGDRGNLGFTDMVTTRFRWGAGKEKTMFDFLPMVFQANSEEPPQCFDIPETYVLEIEIFDPEYPWLGDLGLKWYAVPAVSNMQLEVGGIVYTAAPFNGWYADTEIVRDFADEGRYNMLPRIAKLMGLDVNRNSALWKDEAMLALNKAVLNSFQHSGFGMVDHHSLMSGFFDWYSKEKRDRGFCTGNWKWIIPPLTASACRGYLHLNKMTEYTLKPVYFNGPGWRKYEKECFGVLSREAIRSKMVVLGLTMKACGLFLHNVRKNRIRVFLVYASVSGNTRNYASILASLMNDGASVEVMDAEAFQDTAEFNEKMEKCQIFLFLTSTYGNGVPPRQAFALEKHFSRKECPALEGKHYAVLGFGSSRYPRFCGGARTFDEVISKAGGVRVMDVGTCDELGGEKASFHQWSFDVAERMVSITGKQGYVRLKNALANYKEHQEPFHRLPMPKITNLSRDKLASMALQQILPEAAPPLPGRVMAHSKPKMSKKWMVGTILEVRSLISGQHLGVKFGRATCLVRINLDGCGNPPYLPGDHISIMPENRCSDAELKAYAAGLDFPDVDQVFLVEMDTEKNFEDRMPLLTQIQGKPTTVRIILTWIAGAREPVDQESCSILAQCAASEEDAEVLESLGSDQGDYKAYFEKTALQWMDIFRKFPSLHGNVPLPMLLMLIPSNSPRYYSISSSKRKEKGEVHVTVGKVVYTMKDKVRRRGVCSDHMCNLDPGNRIQFQLHTAAFHLPVDNRAPIILLGAGTGIAPFRGFWQEREVLIKRGQSIGECILIFGCRSKKTDLLFAEELDEAVSVGAITKLVLAESREVPKRYIQDKVIDEGGVLKGLLDNQLCHVYVCGAAEMAGSVSAALDSVAGRSVVDEMFADGRYHEDVFGLPSTKLDEKTES